MWPRYEMWSSQQPLVSPLREERNEGGCPPQSQAPQSCGASLAHCTLASLPETDAVSRDPAALVRGIPLCGAISSALIPHIPHFAPQRRCPAFFSLLRALHVPWSPLEELKQIESPESSAPGAASPLRTVEARPWALEAPAQARLSSLPAFSRAKCQKAGCPRLSIYHSRHAKGLPSACRVSRQDLFFHVARVGTATAPRQNLAVHRKEGERWGAEIPDKGRACYFHRLASRQAIRIRG